MAKIFIDGKEYEVDEGRNVLQAALDNKLDLPYFCWHPAMGSVGACRLCAVKHYRDDNDEHGRLAMGCMTPATDGTRVAIDEPEAEQFRRSVVEWLMINHPHDCPVCDEGGECHLQDMTVMTGHAHRRYRGAKRTHLNQYLGPFIHHEMNRCIQCYRCTRFYCDHTGGDDLGAFGSRDRMYFGRVEDGVLESPFAGNLVEVCPTGVFTDKTLRQHYTRKWDLQSAPSICTHCSLGCNTIMGSRYGSVRRVTSRFNGEVNGYWLCDRGRFGYEHLTGPERMRHATSLQPDTQAPDADDDSMWGAANAAIAEAAATEALAAVGSPRASLETNLAVRSLAPRRFNAGLADEERGLVQPFADGALTGRFLVPSLQDIERADAIVVLGADLTNEAPLLDLACFRAKENGASLHVVGLRGGRLESFADSFHCADSSAAAQWADAIRGQLQASGEDVVATALAGAERPLLISGTQHRDPQLVAAMLRLADALRTPAVSPWVAMALPEANTLGAVLGDADGTSLADTVAAIESGEVTALVVAENDLFTRFEDQTRLSEALQKLATLVVLDHSNTATVGVATFAFPVSAVAESTGTLVNNEGRMQRFYEVVRPQRGIVPGWAAAQRLVAAEHRWNHVDEATASLEVEIAAFAGITEVAPPAGYRHEHQPIPRMSARYSGRNATIDRDALEGLAAVGPDGELPVMRRVSRDPETPMSYSMEGYSGDTPPALLPRVWAPGWNSNEAINQFQIEVGGPLHGGDPGRRIFATENSGAGDSASAAEGVDAPGPAAGEVLVCASAEIFGSELTSRRAPAIGELRPDNYVAVHPAQAEALGLADGEVRTMSFDGGGLSAGFEATIRVDARLPEHVALIPAGYPATRWWQRPRPMRLAAKGTSA